MFLVSLSFKTFFDTISELVARPWMVVKRIHGQPNFLIYYNTPMSAVLFEFKRNPQQTCKCTIYATTYNILYLYSSWPGERACFRYIAVY